MRLFALLFGSFLGLNHSAQAIEFYQIKGSAILNYESAELPSGVALHEAITIKFSDTGEHCLFTLGDRKGSCYIHKYSDIMNVYYEVRVDPEVIARVCAPTENYLTRWNRIMARQRFSVFLFKLVGTRYETLKFSSFGRPEFYDRNEPEVFRLRLDLGKVEAVAFE